MNLNILTLRFFLILLPLVLSAQSPAVMREMIGSAFTENQSYRLLQRICDGSGGRLPGSPANEAAISILTTEARQHGWQVRLEKFTMPGWKRGADDVRVMDPVDKKLQVVALGYSQQTRPFTAELIFAGIGREQDFTARDAAGKIVLVSSEKVEAQELPLRQEAIHTAARHQARAILFINAQAGNVNMAGSGDFQGNATLIPAFSLTREEGLWLSRLLENGTTVRLKLQVQSTIQPVEAHNVVVSLSGKLPAKIVVGAHLDSWDLAQGAIDNGLGTAILFEVARLIHQFSPHNYFSIDFVWFNGEELGLFGSKHYARLHAGEEILAMINMDMTGSPTGFNAMGFDELVPTLENLLENLNGLHLARGVASRPWTNSDHMPFLLAGIPVVTLQAHLDREMLESYHSQNDTFEKVNKKYLSEAAAVVSTLAVHLANLRELPQFRKSPPETVQLLKKHHLDSKLKKQKEWPFEENEQMPANCR